MMIFGQQTSILFIIELIIMLIGAFFAGAEQHRHPHIHEEITHEHRHNHSDKHHTHTHCKANHIHRCG